METLEKTEKKSDFMKRLEQTDRLLEETRTFLLTQGETLDLTTQWLTIREYCNRFKIDNTQTVTNWIRRGVIPKEDIRTIPELNNIRMIRAKEYQE